MPTYKIRGIDVDFPFEAYDCQLVYMEKVIQSLQNKCNALLESPTGTGKTLCLLCATLAWRKSLGPFSTSGNQTDGQIAGSQSVENLSQSGAPKPPPIVYTSRTHSQLRQVIQELKRCSYRPKMVVLGSREQLCIHKEVSLLRGSAQNNACRFLCKKGSKRHCYHYSRTTDFMKQNSQIGNEPIDIEDLVNIGRSSGPCPYYVSRELHKVVDIVFAPYNYLIDPGYRKGLDLRWENSVLIFDEAHNLESLCADAASFDLHSGLLTSCISEAKNCIDLSAGREQSNDKSSKPDNFAILRALLLKLEKRIAEVPINSKELGFTKPGPYIYELLADLNITQETASKLIDTIEEGVELLREDKMQKGMDTSCRLESIRDILNIIFRDKGTVHSQFYRVHVQEAEVNATDVLKGKAHRTLSWWCFNPGIAMQELSKKGVGSIILTSGTLSPMDSFALELKLDFPVRLENPHVISSNQIWAGVVPTGPSSYSLNSSYRNRDSLEYKQELGNAIVNIARIVPDGLLVFFPSYYLLDQCIECWKNMSHGNSTTIWERICKHKKPVVEPRQSALFPLAIEDYMAKLRDTSTSGAVFFAVCRGKVSEGLDFSDHAGRAVVITGMPFATRTDPKVRLKREYLDLQSQSQKEGYKGLKLPVLTGEDWYNQQASRAVNQAIGRVIRHRHDYGAIIFCDERFAQPYRQSQISLWIQPHIKSYSKFGDVVFMLTRFFRDGVNHGPMRVNHVPTNPKLIKTEDMGDEREMKLMEPLVKSYTEKLPSLTAAVDQACVSSLPGVKRSNSSHFGEILPANRSSLSPYKAIQTFKLKGSSDLFQYEKKSLLSGRKDVRFQSHEAINLTGNSLLDEKPRKEEIIASCSIKKRKVLNGEDDVVQHISSAPEIASSGERSQLSPFSITRLVKHEKPQLSGSESKINAEVSALPCKVDGTIRQKDAEFVSQKGEVVLSSARGDEETKGSAFLVQVQEKLSAAEYKEFVGFMKALKSKAMKIGHVLQSIANLFAGPDRLPLRRRFKDYVPAKYRSTYEQYLEKND